ncbi:MAG: hypothetical protein AUK35_10685 [Zetaproteobacteria bacterium CG2_30_46_52]|nr:MAG: hypothetical protein AUK35_10685 [Zetaproteobacteria bacterium CG2_30_46_52]
MNAKVDKFSLTLQDLAKSGRQWDEVIPLAVLWDESFAGFDQNSPLFGEMHWQGELVPSNGLFDLTGAWQFTMPRQCGRCNEEFAMPMQGDVSVQYVLSERKRDEEDDDGVDHDVLEAPGALNLLDVLREQFWLAWKPMAICSPDCKGLCLNCGENLNEGECQCESNFDNSPFAGLKNLKFDA